MCKVLARQLITVFAAQTCSYSLLCSPLSVLPRLGCLSLGTLRAGPVDGNIFSSDSHSSPAINSPDPEACTASLDAYLAARVALFPAADTLARPRRQIYWASRRVPQRRLLFAGRHGIFSGDHRSSSGSRHTEPGG